jgi:hypothetical protein
LAFGETHISRILCCVVVCLAYAWCHCDLRRDLAESFHPSLHIDVDGELHQFDGITHIAELH